MFCVESVKSLIRYYDIFKRKKLAGEHNLNIATIFSYAANEDDADANGFIPEEVSVVEEPRALYGLQAHSREKLDEYIEDYNQLYDVKYSTKTSEDFYNYYNDISNKLKDRERQPENVNNRIDVLLVVNMFLTGFDVKKVNSLYVDKNLKYHGLIQAFSRTNRILNELKSQGNIVVFRNLKNQTVSYLLFPNWRCNSQADKPFLVADINAIAKYHLRIGKLEAFMNVPLLNVVLKLHSLQCHCHFDFSE